MAEKKSFILYDDQYAPVSGFTLEQKGMLFDALFKYNAGEELEFADPLVELAFNFFRQAFVRDKANYKERCDKNKANAAKRYESAKVNGLDANGCDRMQSDAMDADNDNDTDTDISKSDTTVSLVSGDTPTDGKPQPFPDCPHRKIIDLYHETLPELPSVKPDLWDGGRADALRTRWKETLRRLKKLGKRYDEAAGLRWWRGYFTLVRASPLLMGKITNQRSGRIWRADLAWLVKAENYKKVLERRYVEEPAA